MSLSRRLLGLLLLVGVLLGMQQHALTHAYAHGLAGAAHAGKYAAHDHAGHHGHTGQPVEDLCVVCLALDALQAAPPAVLPVLALQLAAPHYAALAVPPAPSLRRLAYFHSRAPPSLLS